MFKEKILFCMFLIKFFFGKTLISGEALKNYDEIKKKNTKFCLFCIFSSKYGIKKKKKKT